MVGILRESTLLSSLEDIVGQMQMGKLDDQQVHDILSNVTNPYPQDFGKPNKEESSGGAICYLTEGELDLLCFLSDKRSDEPRDMAVLDSLESFLDDLKRVIKNVKLDTERVIHDDEREELKKIWERARKWD
tara:strand:- start:35 stop:430 length:396 start_codon:yes stop_codon:yes gene_type:complete